jgi:flavin reductase (DIM6/NTAB) family NADH-FMN oxidoreductase RutF
MALKLPSVLAQATPDSLPRVTDPGATFLRLAGSLDYPLFIVTAGDGRQREGCVIGFATQSSFDPPRLLACLSRENRTYRLALGVEVLAVHLVPRSQLKLAKLFGGETGDEIDKFERCEWHAGPRGLPILDGCPSWLVGEILARHDLGDHVGFLLAPLEVQYVPSDEGIVYFHEVKDDIEPGHPAT